MAKRKYTYLRVAAGAPPPPTKRRKTMPRRFTLGVTPYGKEMKFVDREATHAIVSTTSGAECDPTSSIDCLNATAQGDGEMDRDGRRQFTHSVEVKGHVKFAFSFTGDVPEFPPYVKIALVLDTQTNGVQLDSEKVFSDPTSTFLDATMFRNLQFTSRFRILKTCVVHPRTVMGGYAGNGTTNEPIASTQLHPFSMYYKFKKPLISTYTSTTAVIANIADNSLHIIAIASDDTVDVATTTLIYKSRVRFTSG